MGIEGLGCTRLDHLDFKGWEADGLDVQARATCLWNTTNLSTEVLRILHVAWNLILLPPENR